MEKCDNCNLMIEKFSYELHTAHCFRFLHACPCGQIISTKSNHDHQKKFHLKIECQYCDIILEYWEKDKHQCPKQYIQCRVCSLLLPPCELPGHQTLCELRTTQCSQCKQYFKYLDIKKHEAENCMPALEHRRAEPKSSKKPVRNRKKNKWVPMGFLTFSKDRSYNNDDLDHSLAQKIQEEIIYEELAEEGFR
jgi:hypothetical protein